MAATVRSLILAHGTTTTILSGINLNGSSGVVMKIKSDTSVPATINANIGNIFLNYINSANMIFGGGSAWIALNSVNGGNNVGLIFTQNIQMLVVDTWKTAALVQVRINGVWKVVSKAQIQISGVWKSIF